MAPIKANKMENKLVRLSKADFLPLKISTLYKWRHMNKYPELFVKLGGAVFVDLNYLEKIIEMSRGR
jgi:hypothetical protein